MNVKQRPLVKCWNCGGLFFRISVSMYVRRKWGMPRLSSVGHDMICEKCGVVNDFGKATR